MCRMFEVHLKLSDKQLKTIVFLFKRLYQNRMIIITTNL